MLLHRNQAAFKDGSNQQKQPSQKSILNRNVSASVLDYMTVEDFILHTLQASENSQSSVVPILSMLASQLKGLRTLFSLHSYLIANEAPPNILESVRETALLMLNCEDIILVQFEETKNCYIITHCQDRKWIGIPIEGTTADNSGKGFAQFKSSFIQAIAHHTNSSVDLTSSDLLISPIQLYNKSRGYVIARNKTIDMPNTAASNSSSVSATTAINSVATSTEVNSCTAIIEFTDTDATLLGFIAVTLGIALKDNSASVSVSSSIALKSNLSGSNSIHKSNALQSSTVIDNVDYVNNLFITESCTNIIKCKSFSELKNEICSLLTSLFVIDYISMYEIRIDSSVSSSTYRSLFMFPMVSSDNPMSNNDESNNNTNSNNNRNSYQSERKRDLEVNGIRLSQCSEIAEAVKTGSTRIISIPELNSMNSFGCVGGTAFAAGASNEQLQATCASVLLLSIPTDYTPLFHINNNAGSCVSSSSNNNTSSVQNHSHRDGVISTATTRNNSVTTTTTTATTSSASAAASTSTASSVSSSSNGVNSRTNSLTTIAGITSTLTGTLSILVPYVSSTISNILQRIQQQSVLSLLETKYNIVNNTLFALKDYVLILDANGIIIAANEGMESFLLEHQPPTNLPNFNRTNKQKISSTTKKSSDIQSTDIDDAITASVSAVNNILTGRLSEASATSPRFFLDTQSQIRSICGLHYTELVHNQLCMQLYNDISETLRNASSHNATAAKLSESNYAITNEIIDYSVFAIDMKGVVSQSNVTVTVGKDTLVFNWDESIDDLCEFVADEGEDSADLGKSEDMRKEDLISSEAVKRLTSAGSIDIPILAINSNNTTLNNGVVTRNTSAPIPSAITTNKTTTKQDSQQQQPQQQQNGQKKLSTADSSTSPAANSTAPNSAVAPMIEAVVIIIKPIHDSNIVLETIRKYSLECTFDTNNINIDAASGVVMIANSLLESCASIFKLSSGYQRELEAVNTSLSQLSYSLKKQEEIEASPNYSTMFSCRDLHSLSLPSKGESTVHSFRTKLINPNNTSDSTAAVVTTGTTKEDTSLEPSKATNDLSSAESPMSHPHQSMLVSSAFHPPSSLFTWDFNALDISDKSMLSSCIGHIFQEMVDLPALGVDITSLGLYVSVISRNYHDNPFHNFNHAVTVTHIAYKLMDAINIKSFLSPIKIFCILLSCLIHDVDHPGNTNGFEVNCGSDLALRYNDQSVLENHHCSTAFRLMKKPGLDIIKNLKSAVASDIRKTVISCVLSTDMAIHFTFVEDLKKFAIVAKDIPNRNLLYSENANVMLLCKTLVHAADLSNPVRKFVLTRKWAELIALEFNAQVAKEEELGLPILGFMVSKNLKMVCKNEMGFSSFVVAPLWRSIETILPELHFLVDQLDNNQAEWKSIIDKLEAEEEGDDDDEDETATSASSPPATGSRT